LTRLIRALIDTRALQANLRVVRSRAPRSRVMAVVKANAYGHGLVEVARALSEADAFAVARFEEALELRAAGVRQPIVLLEGVFESAQLALAATHDLEIVVHEREQLDLLASWRGEHRFLAWLKIDTGMNRLGFRPEAFSGALARLESLRVKPREIRLLTHLARADERECSMTREQLARFAALAAGRRFATSIGNSAGIFGWDGEASGDWVRPGIALYGVSPFAGESAAALGLAPVMTLETKVIAVRHVPRGECVGYGGTWTAERDSVIAILAAGYGDGFTRRLRAGAPVMLDGRRAPIVGRISMDMTAVDVTELPPTRVGATAILWGRDLPVEEVAQAAGTIGYELLCAVSPRVPRELV
jgi:alanine racemase